MSTGSRDAWNENEWSKELFPPSLSPSSSPLCLCSDDLEDDPESSIMAVSYHNMAVEHEHLGEYDKAMQAYLKSVSAHEVLYCGGYFQWYSLSEEGRQAWISGRISLRFLCAKLEVTVDSPIR